MNDPRQFRNALGCYPTGVTIVTTRAADGQPIGVTANSFTSVSLDPPMVLWCIDKRAYSLDAFVSAPHFAVHVLREEQQDLSNRFARASGEKFGGIEVGCGLGDVPVLPGCAAVFECALAHVYEGGDHLILVGHVERYEAAPLAPLLYHAGRYAQLQQPVCEAAA